MEKPPLWFLSGMSLALMFSPGAASSRPALSFTALTGTEPGGDTALTRTIVQLFDDDQTLLKDLAKAKLDPSFRQQYNAYQTRVMTEMHLANFFDPAVYALWAHDRAAPAIVQRAVAFRTATDAQLRAIVARNGWPQRAMVGDKAAASFFFLFGHADDDNSWRLAQEPIIDRVFREDHLNPRLYAHMKDRLQDVAGRPQIFGSIMGPDKVAGSAKLFAPLIDDEKTADARRAAIGLPSIQTDLEKFRQGADIGPYMTPMTKGMKLTIDDVYLAPASDVRPSGVAAHR